MYIFSIYYSVSLLCILQNKKFLSKKQISTFCLFISSLCFLQNSETPDILFTYLLRNSEIFLSSLKKLRNLFKSYSSPTPNCSYFSILFYLVLLSYSAYFHSSLGTQKIYKKENKINK